MRMFEKGEPFMSVPCEGWIPDEAMIEEMRQDLIMRDLLEFPTFSEAYLYPRVGKEDARFILAVAEEYEKIIKVLGRNKVLAILEARTQRAARDILEP